MESLSSSEQQDDSGKILMTTPQYQQYQQLQALPERGLLQLQTNAESSLQLSSHWSRYALTEMYGTFIATFTADFAMYLYTAKSDLLTQAIGISLGYFFGSLICWNSHLNAAFTFAFALCKVKPWKFVPTIILSQFIGAVFAHLAFYYNIGSPDTLDGTLAYWFGIAPPVDEITNGRILFSSVCVMTVLIVAFISIFATQLGGNSSMSHVTHSLIVFVTVCCALIYALPAGAQLNPTYFFSAYFVMWILGFDHEYFVLHDHYWWTALAGPILGVIVALCILINITVVTWNEPKNWFTALKKIISPHRH